MPDKIRYVVGFPICQSGPLVLLRKLHPAWQKGLLNGIGGKIEAGETPVAAMERECREEIGLHGLPWEHFADLRGDDFEVSVFAAVLPKEMIAGLPLQNDVGEAVLLLDGLSSVKAMPHVANVPSLIALALVRHSFRFAVISYGLNGDTSQVKEVRS